MPTLTLILPIFGERKKDKLHILKKVGHCVCNSTVMLLTYFYFVRKGTLRLKVEENQQKKNLVSFY